MTLADRIVALLLERGPLPACEIRLELRRRKADVLKALHSDPRFLHTGKRKASLWSVLHTPVWPLNYDAGEDALVASIRQGRRSPEEALLLVVCAVNGAAA